MDIVNFLRNLASPDPYDERPVMHSKELYAAADEIATLRAKVEELTQELDHWKACHTTSVMMNADAAKQLAASQAREQQLREALKKIADTQGAWGPFPEKNEQWRAMVVVVSREALALPHDDSALDRAIEDENLNPWKRAIIDAAVVNWSYKIEHEGDPRAALNDLLYISNQYALDPQVSEDADKLRKLYAAEVLGKWYNKIMQTYNFFATASEMNAEVEQLRKEAE